MSSPKRDDASSTKAIAKLEPTMRSRRVWRAARERERTFVGAGLGDSLSNAGFLGHDFVEAVRGIMGDISAAMDEDPLRPAVRRQLQELLEVTGFDPLNSPSASARDGIIQIMQGVEQLAGALQRSAPDLEVRLAIAMAAVELDANMNASAGEPEATPDDGGLIGRAYRLGVADAILASLADDDGGDAP